MQELEYGISLINKMASKFKKISKTSLVQTASDLNKGIIIALYIQLLNIFVNLSVRIAVYS